jgi:hypothetical protein
MLDSHTLIEDTPLMQDRAFATALRLCGQQPVTLPSGLTLLSRRMAGLPVLMLPRAAPPADLGAQLGQAGLHRCPLILSPEQRCALPPALRIAPARMLWHMDLRAPRILRRAALHQNWRHQLGQAEQAGLRVSERPMPPEHALLDMERHQSAARRYLNWPPALTAAFAQAAPDQTRLFTALLRGHTVAHMLFLIHGSRATYHIGYTSDQGRAVHAHNLLLWEASHALAVRGITALDLGPATTPRIDRFKRRAGAVARATGGTWLRWTPLAPRAAF